ncbi:toprim domain-containing protein [Paenisporosarcina indica]|uniref:toprim domain-containing protein n=1 Tax=Paenisporosarcina indica TaxID=650093 RepID=UPI00095017F8|nr:toprim domain-containing protein [Paenisporosarcina indica]
MLEGKVLLVEGRSDKQRIMRLLAEPIEIICTNGTVSPTRLEEILAPYDHLEIYVFVDADKSGEKLRALIKREFPEAFHLYTDPTYREVATTPLKFLATILLGANIDVKSEFI